MFYASLHKRSIRKQYSNLGGQIAPCSSEILQTIRRLDSVRKSDRPPVCPRKRGLRQSWSWSTETLGRLATWLKGRCSLSGPIKDQGTRAALLLLVQGFDQDDSLEPVLVRVLVMHREPNTTQFRHMSHSPGNSSRQLLARNI